jgi:hypothetical protein
LRACKWKGWAAVSSLGYLDVGSTSMIASAIAGGFAAFVTFFKVTGRKLFGGFRKKAVDTTEQP